MSNCARSGFTLLELIVVLVIISLVTVLTVPRITASIAALSLKEASRKTASSLRYASSTAVSQNTGIRAVADFNKSRLFILEKEFGNSSEAEEFIETDDNLTDVNIYDLPAGIEFVDETDTGSEYCHIVFYGTGGSSGGSLYLENSNERRTEVRVDFITGTIEILEGGE